MGRMTILFDVDDTLLQNQQYPDNYSKIVELIDILKEKNIVFGICTYRPYDKVIEKIVTDYKINGPIITEGGAIFNNKMTLNIIVKEILEEIIEKSNLKYKIIIDNNYNDNNLIIINKDRKNTSTVRFPLKTQKNIKQIINKMKEYNVMKKMNIFISENNDIKINIMPKGTNKINSVEKMIKDNTIILITDYEKNIPKKSKVIVYSVGNNNEFNKQCNNAFSLFGKGIEEILIKIGEEYERL